MATLMLFGLLCLLLAVAPADGGLATAVCQSVYGGACNPLDAPGYFPCCTSPASSCLRHASSCGNYNGSFPGEWRCVVPGEYVPSSQIVPPPFPPVSPNALLLGNDSSSSTTGIGSSTLTTGFATFSIVQNVFTLSTSFCQNPNGTANYNCSAPSDGTLKFDQTIVANIECYSYDVSSRTVYYSARVTSATDDFRNALSVNLASAQLYAAGHGVLYGSFQDADGNGLADHRSIIWNSWDIPTPNLSNLTGDSGSGNIYPSIDPATFCQLKNGMFLEADYVVVDGPNNIVQWIDQNGVAFGTPFVGTVQALSNVPPAIIYENLSTRTLLNGGSLALLIPFPVQSPVPTQLSGQDSSVSTTGTGSATITVGEAVFSFINNQATLQTYFCQNPNGTVNYQCNGPNPALQFNQQINATVLCYSGSAQTVWFSARITSGTADIRVSASSNQGTLSYWAQGFGILYGKFVDTNGDGFADERSIIFDSVDINVANYDTQTGDLDSGNMPRTEDPATFCQWRDGMYLEADYTVINGANNVVQWNSANLPGSPLIGSPFIGTATALVNWPLDALYNNLAYRTLVNGHSLTLV